MLKDLPPDLIDKVPHFGPHFMYDAFGCDLEALTNKVKLAEFLEQLPARIGMERISEPEVFEYHGKIPEHWGVSGKEHFILTGGVFLAESHCTFHTFPEQRFVTLDIYSCKQFNTEKVLTELNEFFGVTPDNVRHTVILRGIGFQH